MPADFPLCNLGGPDGLTLTLPQRDHRRTRNHLLLELGGGSYPNTVVGFWLSVDDARELSAALLKGAEMAEARVVRGDKEAEKKRLDAPGSAS